MKTAVLLMLTLLAPGSDPGSGALRFLDYAPTGVAYWYPSQEACREGMFQLVDALDPSGMPGVVETWCLEVPLDGLLRAAPRRTR